MARNKHIRPEQIEAIVTALHAWDRGRLTWEDICDVAKRVLGYRPSRSGLSSHAEIQAAFSARKKNLRERPAGRVPSPGTLAAASRMLAAKNNEIDSLKRQVTAYRDKFDRWRYNAMLLNVKLEKLDQPLPHISRSGAK